MLWIAKSCGSESLICPKRLMRRVEISNASALHTSGCSFTESSIVPIVVMHCDLRSYYDCVSNGVIYRIFLRAGIKV